MPFKPNYNHQRSERLRAKEQKKLEKRQRREDEAAKRKGMIESPEDGETGETTIENPPENADGPQETTH